MQEWIKLGNWLLDNSCKDYMTIRARKMSQPTPFQMYTKIGFFLPKTAKGYDFFRAKQHRVSSKVNKFRKIKSSKVLSAKVVVICEISQAKKLEGTSDGPSSQVKDEVFPL